MKYFKGNSSGSPHTYYKNMADEVITLRIFDLVSDGAAISERKISNVTGLAAGLVHSFMRSVIAKGWVRVKRVNAKRWLYFMTAEGFTEKSRLTLNYLSKTVKSYKAATNIAQDQIAKCLANNKTRLVIIGENELAEIVVLNIKAAEGLVLAGVLGESRTGGTVVAGVGTFPYESLKKMKFDKILVCEFGFFEWIKNNGEAGLESLSVNLIEEFIALKTYMSD